MKGGLAEGKIIILSKLLICFFIFSACKKNDNPSTSVVKTKTELLTQRPWRLTAATIPGGQSITNFIQDCQKDNIHSFFAGGTGNTDEVIIKSNPADPQSNAFTWTFQSSETSLYISNILYTTGSNTFTIVSISESTLIVYQFISLPAGIPASVTFTFNHF